MTPLSRYVVETVITLVAVVALSIVLLSALRRVGVGKAAGPLELLARLPLEGRRAVYLVRVGETVYVLGASENAMQKLGELPQGSLPREPSPEQQSFAQVLRRAVGLRAGASSQDSARSPAKEPPSPEEKS
jgi:flagellar biogenesis protein FliO